MMRWLLVLHLLGMVFWIGALLLATKLLSTRSRETNPDTRQTLANVERALFRGWAHPGAAIMVLTGIGLVATNTSYYLRAGWLHAKFLLVLLLIGVHFWIYRRMRAVTAGGDFTRGESAGLHGGVALIVALILVFVFVKPFGP
jgi:putative membrane protein